MFFNPWSACRNVLQFTVISSGLVLSVGSAGTKKPKAGTVFKFQNTRCTAEPPSSLKWLAKRASISCRYNGGEPKERYTKARKSKGTTCPDGAFFHGLHVECIGGTFEGRMLKPLKASASPVELFTTSQERGALTKVVLDGLNGYRGALNLKPLTWSDRLAGFAKEWAMRLAKQGGGRAAYSNSKTTGQGETVWVGAAGTYSVEKMIRAWGAEKQHFMNGIFPKISRSGDWKQVRNYSQIVWGATKLVGCAIIRVGEHDIFVCRFWEPGNVLGRRVY
jgi:hypothetical protein